jgi:hypothetical protein
MPKQSTIRDLLFRNEAVPSGPSPVVFINETKNEVLSLGVQIEIPRISVKAIDRISIAPVVEAIMCAVPGYFRGHTILESPYPAAETHHLHFVRQIQGVRQSFIHMFKLDFRFASDMGTNHRDGTADFYPSYSTDRVLYKSVLIPVDSVERNDEGITSFVPSRISMKESVDSDKFKFAHTIFDEFDPTEFNERIYEHLDADLFPASHRIYPFIEYGFFSIMMRIPDPETSVIDEAVRIFEPLYSRLHCVFSGMTPDYAAVSAYSDELLLHDGLVIESDSFRKKIKDFFSRYSFYQNDELALKRWRRLDVKG